MMNKSGMKNGSSYSQVQTFRSTVLKFHGKEKAEHPNTLWVKCKWVWIKIMDLTLLPELQSQSNCTAYSDKLLVQPSLPHPIQSASHLGPGGKASWVCLKTQTPIGLSQFITTFPVQVTSEAFKPLRSGSLSSQWRSHVCTNPIFLTHLILKYTYINILSDGRKN